jgi:hypothetical protein
VSTHLIANGESNMLSTSNARRLTWFLQQKIFRFDAGDFRNRRENMRARRCRTFNTIAMVDLTIACFFVQVEVREMIVEIGCTSTQISAQQRGMRREDQRTIVTTQSSHHQTDTGEPFVKMSDHIALLYAFELFDKLHEAEIELLTIDSFGSRTVPMNQKTQKPKMTASFDSRS